MGAGFTLTLLPVLAAVTLIVGANQLHVWVLYRKERLHLWWAVWAFLGLLFVIARWFDQTASTSAVSLAAVRAEYAIGLFMMLSLLAVVHEQVGFPFSSRTLALVGAVSLVVAAATFIDGVVVYAPALPRTDALGQSYLDGRPGAFVPAYMALLTAITAAGLVTLRRGGALPRHRRVGLLLMLLIIPVAGLNDLLMALRWIHAIRVTEYGTVAIVLASHYVLVHDYRRLLAEEGFRPLFEGAPDAMFVSRAGQVILANPAAARFLGHASPEALKGRVLPPLERFAGADGRIRLGEAVRVPLQLGAERVEVTIVRDVTERAEMGRKLQFAERMASLGTLAAGVAHEINNPLSFVLANLRQLKKVAESEEARELVADCEDGTRRVAHIVRDLKAFSRPGEDDASERVALAEVMVGAAEMAAHEIRHRARLVKQLDPAVTVDGNRVRLGQVFLNLIVNAAQAIREGDAERQQLVLRTYHDAEGRAVAEVTDSGCGIDPAILPRIFDPFFTTKAVGMGTGLGLSTVHGIVHAMGGVVEVETKVGAGTTMRVRLPAAHEQATEAEIAEAAPKAVRGLRVLVVDDEPLLAKSIARMLEGHQVETVTSGRAAVERCLTRQLDAVVCDLMMPETTGMDVYEQVRELCPGLERRIVFVTGGVFTSRGEEFVRTVPNRVLEKPLTPDALRAAVAELG